VKGFVQKIKQKFSKSKNLSLVMGAQYERQNYGQPLDRSQSSQFPGRDVETYFRPSSLPIKNTLFKDHHFFDPFYDKDVNEMKLPATLTRTAEGTVLAYFSVLREAENLTPSQIGGCGTVGMAKLPYPIAYQFFTKDYHKNVSYQEYLQSFRGIGHLNVIKLNRLPDENDVVSYFIELETIEGSSKGITYFAYYYGKIQLKKVHSHYKIDQMKLYGEDFLCAPYHLWQHDAEAVVEVMYGNWCQLIKKKLPTTQEGYVKTIDFIGTDGAEYRLIFYQLTNDTDVLISQFRKHSKGNFETIHIDPYDCVKKR
jgi:hypothetical protein